MKDPNEHLAANQRLWSRRSVTFDRRRNFIFRLFQRLLVDSLGLTPPAAFLDVGCGTGWAVCYAASWLQGQGRFAGIDISRGMIERAKSNSTGQPGVEFSEASAEQLPFEAASFDHIICTLSFHHYLHPQQAVHEMARVLRPGGRVHILDITSDDPFMRWIDTLTKRAEPEHVSMYSSREFGRMFEEAGLQHIHSRLFGIYYPLHVHVGGKAPD